MIISLIDLLLAPFAIFLIIYLSTLYKSQYEAENSSYKYFMPGLLVKMLGGISLCLVYTYYYNGGDTHQYFNDGVAMINLLFKKPAYFFDILINGIGPNLQKYYYFDNQTGFPGYAKDHYTFFVVRLTCLLILVSFKSFIVTTLLMAWLSFFGVWKLYQVFVSEFPDLKKELAIAVLFIPSVFFWGSGLLKDTITFSAIGFYIFSFYKGFIKRDNYIMNGIVLLLTSFVIISIKPYIFFALMPGSLIWIAGSIIEKFRGNFIKFFLTPILLSAVLGSGYLLLETLGDTLGHYTLDNVLERAVVVQQDLKREYYYGNSFDIGDFDATLPSILSKAPLAITAALFRPFLWEANNIVMLLSAIENFAILLLTIYLVFKVRILKFIKLMFAHNLLVFSIVFSLFFAFSVGLATSNFGSLVRYKIPLMPFYVASLFIIRHFDKQLSTRNKQEIEAGRSVTYAD